jgi:hypothetical protein
VQKELSPKKNIVVISKNHLASSIKNAEDAQNILPYANEDEKIEEYDENEEEEVSLVGISLINSFLF